MMAASEDVSCAEVLKVLADETRLAVMRRLMQGPQRVGELNEQLHVEQTLLSHHLRVLRDAGLVSSRRIGKSVEYKISDRVESKRRGAVLELGCCKLDFR